MNRNREQLLIFLFGFLVAAILFGLGTFAFFKFLKPVATPIIKAPTEKTQKVKVAIVTEKIEKGEEIQEVKLKLDLRDKNTVPLNSVIDTNLVVGKRANATLDPNVILTDSMIISTNDIFNPDERLKDYEVTTGLVAGQVKEGDYIDIEFVKPEGTTFTVLSKKKVKKRLESKIIVQLTMAERQLLNQATAEQTVNGGRIDSVLYLDETQPASVVTYIPAKLEIKNPQAQQPIVQQPIVQTTPSADYVREEPIDSQTGGKVR